MSDAKCDEHFNYATQFNFPCNFQVQQIHQYDNGALNSNEHKQLKCFECLINTVY